MSDFSIKILADELGKDLEKLAPQVEAELEEAVENLATAAHASLVAQVQGMKMDPKNRQDYLRGLKYQKLDDTNFVIYLDGEWPKKLEEGYSSYDMKAKLLSSEKTVKIGSRAGQPWVQTSKAGKKYAAVPFGHKPLSAEGSKGNMAEDIKRLTAKNRQGKDQSILETFNDNNGKPLRGKVATVTDSATKNLQGLTKYQSVSKTGTVSSVYMTFRMVSEDSPGWQHPGHRGYLLFQEMEQYVEKELENIVKNLL